MCFCAHKCACKRLHYWESDSSACISNWQFSGFSSISAKVMESASGLAMTRFHPRSPKARDRGHPQRSMETSSGSGPPASRGFWNGS